MRPPALATLGIVGAVAGVVGLIAPPVWRSFRLEPVAAIEAPTAQSTVARCFVAKGSVVPSSIRRPLWLLKAEGRHRWREVGRIYPPPGTWASRVCVSDDAVRTVRLALVLADEQLDAALSRLVPEAEDEEEIPDWLKPRAAGEQSGRRGRRHGFAPLPAGAALVTFVDVRLADDVERYLYVALKEAAALQPREPDTCGRRRTGSRVVSVGPLGKAAGRGRACDGESRH